MPFQSKLGLLTGEDSERKKEWEATTSHASTLLRLPGSCRLLSLSGNYYSHQPYVSHGAGITQRENGDAHAPPPDKTNISEPVAEATGPKPIDCYFTITIFFSDWNLPASMR